MDFKVDYKIGEWIVMNLRYADDIILLATSEAELQELVNHLARVSRKYSLLINVDKTKVMASNGIACCILIQNEQLEKAHTFQYCGSLITEDGECTMEFCTRLNGGRRLGHHSRKYEKSRHTDFNKDLTWTAKKTNEWVLNKARVKTGLLDTVKARKLACYSHTMRKQGSCLLEKEIMQGTMSGACRRGRPCTAWMDNINTWTGHSMKESIRTKKDRDKWRKYIHGVANPRLQDG